MQDITEVIQTQNNQYEHKSLQIDVRHDVLIRSYNLKCKFRDTMSCKWRWKKRFRLWRTFVSEIITKNISMLLKKLNVRSYFRFFNIICVMMCIFTPDSYFMLRDWNVSMHSITIWKKTKEIPIDFQKDRITLKNDFHHHNFVGEYCIWDLLQEWTLQIEKSWNF